MMITTLQGFGTDWKERGHQRLALGADLLDRAGNADGIVGHHDKGVEPIAGEHILDLAVLLGRVELAVIDGGLDAANLLGSFHNAFVDRLIEPVLGRGGEKRDPETVGESG
jgi:hypothetical protein